MNDHNWYSTRQRSVILTFRDEHAARQFDQTADRDGTNLAVYRALVECEAERSTQLELPL